MTERREGDEADDEAPAGEPDRSGDADAPGEGGAAEPEDQDAAATDADASSAKPSTPSDDDAKDDDAKPAPAAADAEPAAEKEDASESTPKGEAASADKKDGTSRWWLALVALILVEFWVYGKRGDVEVCVGKQGTHDFALVGQERTDENRWSFPRCESRENLGLRSHYDEVVDDAAKVACRGATLFRQRGEGPACVEGADGWTRQVEASFIWPWDARYYNHLLWFLN